MYTISAEASFDSAHFLAGYEGKCSNLHGHHWTISAEICGKDLIRDGQHRGMITDFGDIKRALQAIAEQYDHCLIYEDKTLKTTTVGALLSEGFRLVALPCRPTAENLARIIYGKIKERGYAVCKVTVYETPGNCAAYSED